MSCFTFEFMFFISTVITTPRRVKKTKSCTFRDGFSCCFKRELFLGV